jgi:hypothetical protein
MRVPRLQVVPRPRLPQQQHHHDLRQLPRLRRAQHLGRLLHRRIRDANFDHADAITALCKLLTSNGKTAPLDGRQIAGLKLHRETDALRAPQSGDDEEIEDNPAAVTTATRDILLKALTHTHNTPETAFDTQIKAETLAVAVTTSDAAIAKLRVKLQRMEAEAVDLKRIHATNFEF